MQAIEDAVLTCAWQSPPAWERIRTQIPPEAFTESRKGIYTSMLSAKRLDAVLVAAELERKGLMDAQKAKRELLGYQMSTSASAAHLEQYLDKLTETYQRRRLAETLEHAARLARDPNQDNTPELMTKVEQAVLDVTRSLVPITEYTTKSQRMTEALDDIAAIMERGEGLSGFDTGMSELNELTGGWTPGTYNVILGLPSAGKTALWLQSANHVANKYGPVAMVQLEMRQAMLERRNLARETRTNYGNINRGKLTQQQYNKLAHMANQLVQFQNEVYILSPGKRTLQQIERWIRYMHTEYGIQTFWIDNLKRIVNEDPGINRLELERLTQSSKTFGDLATELGITVIMLHHVRKLAQGQKKITVQDAFGGAAPIQDADNIILLQNTEDSSIKELESGKSRDAGENGRSFTVSFYGQFQLFDSFGKTSAVPQQEVGELPW